MSETPRDPSDLTPHERVRALFFELLDLPEDARATRLEGATADDPALRAGVERLLRADAQASRFLLPAGAERPASATDRVGQRLGTYRLISILGMGGMGAVYLAERADDAFQKQVAIKVLKRGLDTEHILRRFRVEREVLAQLEHPGIARLIDSGTTDDGLPYLVMEYVDGMPLDEWVSSRKTALRERLQLFRRICDVVGFAHRNLVVHRDLKPGNIMVDREGRVRLLDFGISKLLDPSLLSESLPQTQHGWRAFTPEYASPEQVKGGAASTATDVYSLGAILYELVSGRRVHRFASRAPAEVERAVCGADPDPPSRRLARDVRDDIAAPSGAAPDAAPRDLSGDIDGIVMKALRGEPEHRYGTVAELADDVRRHLEGLPVTAIGDTWVYRSAKFMRRHRLALGVAFGVMLLSVVFSIVVIVQATRIASERNRAEREAATARRTVELLKQTFLAADPYEAPSDSMTMRDMLEDATRRVRHGAGETPAVQAELLEVLGQVRLSLAQFDRAESLFNESLLLRERALGAQSADAARGRTSLARLAHARGDYAGAADGYARARRILVARLGEDASEVARLDIHRGLNAAQMNDLGEAEEALVHAHDVLGTAGAADAREMAELLLARGRVAWARGDYATALTLEREGVDSLSRVLGPDHLELARAIEQLATTIDESTHDYHAALVLKQRAHEIRVRRLGAEHPDVALSLYNLGYSRYLMGDLDGARQQLAAAGAIFARVLGATHAHRAYALGGLGLTEGARGDHAASVRHLREAVSIAERALGSEHRITGVLRMSLGTSEWGAGRVDEAERLMRTAHATLVASPEHRTLAWGATTLASFVASRGRTAEAAQLFASVATRVDSLVTDAEMCMYAAGYHASRGDTREADRWLGRALDAGGTLSGAEYHPALAPLRGTPAFDARIREARRRRG